jgi:HPt (histidine-containing phosphotransfer) domain-containing protein
MNKKGHPVAGESAIDRSAQHEGVLLEQAMSKQTDRLLEPVVNFPALLTRVSDDRELVRELFEMFKTEFPPLLQSLEQSARCGHMKDLEKTSHTMKGMLSSLSATPAAVVAARLEQIGRSGETARLGETFAIFESEVGRLLSEIDTYLAGAQP